MSFEQHIDTQKLDDIAGKLEGIKRDMDTKVEEIWQTINQLEANNAYQSAESVKFKETFKKFQTTTQAEFDKDMDAFAAFIRKVSKQHTELAAAITSNIDSQLEGQTQSVASKFNS